MILVVFSFDCIVNETSQNIEINFGDIAQKWQFIFYDFGQDYEGGNGFRFIELDSVLSKS